MKIVQQLEHRAGKDATGEIGDGVGILTQIPYQYLKKVVTQFELPEKGCFGVGMFFMPQDEKYRARIQKMFETIIRKEGMRFIGWREVPVNPSVLGQFALDAMPYITQAFIEKNDKIKKGLDFDRKYIRQEECLNIVNLKIHMSVLYLVVRLFIKECSLFINYAHFIKTYRIQITNQPLH